MNAKKLDFRICSIFILIVVLTAEGQDPLDRLRAINPPSTWNTLKGVAYGNGQWIAGGDAGVVLASMDGMIWTPRVSGVADDINVIVFTNGLFVAGGGSFDAGGSILTSADGTNWTQRVSGGGGVYGISYAGGHWVAVGYGGVLVSTDAINWTRGQLDTWDMLNGVSYGNGRWVAVGSMIWSSTNALDWTHQSSGVDGTISGVAFGNGQWIASFASLDPPVFIVGSTDGINWSTRANLLNVGIPRAITHVNGQFVMAGDGIVSSTDGVVWTSRKPLTGGFTDIRGLTAGNGQWLAVGGHGEMFRSDPLPPRLQLLSDASTGLFQLRSLQLSVSSHGIYEIDTSTNLSSWQPWVVLNVTNDTLNFADPTSTNSSHRFYRALTY